MRFDRFIAEWQWRRGEHITIIAPTGSGKTVLARMLLRRAPLPWVVVFGVKKTDPELYGQFQKEGYRIAHTFDAEPPESVDELRVVYVPRSAKRGAEGEAVRARAFRDALHDIEDSGNWVCVADDVQYMSEDMGLRKDFGILWKIGRSEGISIVANAQEPVSIPPMAYGAASHLFIFKNPDMYRVRRLGELTGFNRDVAFETITRLPKHEFLYINKDTGYMVRSMALLH